MNGTAAGYTKAAEGGFKGLLRAVFLTKRAVSSTQYGTVTVSFLQITFSVNTHGVRIIPELSYLFFSATPTNFGTPLILERYIICKMKIYAIIITSIMINVGV